MKTGVLIDKKRGKLSELDILKRIVTAVNIITGDDGRQAERVLDTFVRLCKMSEQEYKRQVEFYG
jgi:hypothetical protein|tara:strand:+ start:351 stop:545 length:195 start_codon:yes stop_codon:yes gene_type:complete